MVRITGVKGWITLDYVYFVRENTVVVVVVVSGTTIRFFVGVVILTEKVRK
jgi:hypothetical protein